MAEGQGVVSHACVLMLFVEREELFEFAFKELEDSLNELQTQFEANSGSVDMTRKPLDLQKFTTKINLLKQQINKYVLIIVVVILVIAYSYISLPPP